MLISKWAYNWKILFNTDPGKPAIRFQDKNMFKFKNLNKIQIERVSYQEHLGIILDEKRNFKQHIDNTISKINESISVTKKVRHSLPWK